MSDATTITPTSDTTRPPRRAASLAALAVLTALLAGGGWATYHAVVKSAPMAVGNDFRADPIRSWERRRVAAPAAPPQPVVVAPGQVVTVRVPGLVLTATGRPDGSWRLNFLHRGAGPAPDAQAVELLNHRRRIVEAKRPPADLKITDPQKAALAAMPATPPELDAAATDQVIGLCRKLVKAPTDAALKKELEQIVIAAAKADRAKVAATYAARAAQVRSILSPEQVQSLLTGNARPAAPRPATQRAGSPRTE